MKNIYIILLFSWLYHELISYYVWVKFIAIKCLIYILIKMIFDNNWSITNCLSKLSIYIWIQCICAFHVCAFPFLLFLFLLCTRFTISRDIEYCSYTVHRTHNYFIQKKKILKIGSMTLFTHLKIILLQYFQFSAK